MNTFKTTTKGIVYSQTQKVFFILFLFIFLNIKFLHAQKFENLSFENLCDTSKTSFCHWNLSWINNAKLGKSGVENEYALHIEGKANSSIGFVEQFAVIDTSSSIRLISFSGKIKTENLTGKGAGLSLTLLDEQGNYLSTQYMGNNILKGISGNTPWTEYQLEAVCTPQTHSLIIGCIMQGQGNAWFDDLDIAFEPIKNRRPNKLSQNYINQVCDTIAKHSLRRDSIDLGTLKSTALNIAGQAEDYAGCHLAIQYLINSLGDHHSFFMPQNSVKQWQGGKEGRSDAKNIKYANHKRIEGFGYISVPGFHSNDRELKIHFADSIQLALRQLEDSNIEGWIIDLRENDGGNMEPMLAGLGPLFDTDTLGYLVDIEGNKEAWGYKNGAPFSGNDFGESASNPIIIKNKNLPIAVLTGPTTGSSGEIIVISFIGNKNTKSFGKPTWGISTGNGEFDLLDGSKLFLTSTTMADRNGKTYGGKINPDYLVEEPTGGDHDLEEAIRWLKMQND